MFRVDRFYGFLDAADLKQAATITKQRFEKNRDKLFTFLRYDGVPWNNNNTEHAVQGVRKASGCNRWNVHEKGVDRYLTS